MLVHNKNGTVYFFFETIYLSIIKNKKGKTIKPIGSIKKGGKQK